MESLGARLLGVTPLVERPASRKIRWISFGRELGQGCRHFVMVDCWRVHDGRADAIDLLLPCYLPIIPHGLGRQADLLTRLRLNFVKYIGQCLPLHLFLSVSIGISRRMNLR